MWGDLIRSLDATATFREPAAGAALWECEQALGQALAADLAALLRESDGVQLTNGTSIWPLARIAQVNAEMRTDAEWSRIHMFAMALGHPLSVDLTALLLVPRREAHGLHDIYRWDHEDDSRALVAPDLAGYIRSCRQV